MTSPANLEVVRSETNVGLDTIVVLAGDGCLVHHTLLCHTTVLGQGTAGLVSTVATFTGGIIGNIGLQNFTIVLGNFSFHVGQTRIGKFEGVCVANLVEFVVRRKGSFDNFHEFFANVRLNIVTPWWVPPGDFPGSSPFLLLGWHSSTLIKLQVKPVSGLP